MLPNVYDVNMFPSKIRMENQELMNSWEHEK
jgi:hypothetical protein